MDLGVPMEVKISKTLSPTFRFDFEGVVSKMKDDHLEMLDSFNIKD
jgi:hypothetical protein